MPIREQISPVIKTAVIDAVSNAVLSASVIDFAHKTFRERVAARTEIADEAVETILAALREGHLEGDAVVLTKAEHRLLLIEARRWPDGMWVKADEICDGLHPSERSVRIVAKDRSVWCTVSAQSLVNGHISICWPVERRDGFLLIELPREADNGQWRIWVAEASLTGDPDGVFASDRALPAKTGGRHGE